MKLGFMKGKKNFSYNEYMNLFRNNEYVKNYYQLYSIKLNLKNFLGYMTYKCEIDAIKRLSNLKHEIILDMPCGTGKLFPIFKNKTLIGTDSSKNMLSLIDKRRKSILVLADISHLPFKSNSIDTIICHRFLHRMPIDICSIIIKEICRVSRKDIILYFSIRNFLTDYILFLEEKLKIGNRGTVFYISKEDVDKQIEDNNFHFVEDTNVIPIISTGYVIKASKRKYHEDI